MVVRQHLNVHTYQPETNVRERILKEALGAHSILVYWEAIAHSIPSKYEKYSTELLRAIIKLWITIQGHSFAKGWTMKFETKYKKGIRKTLKEKSNHSTEQ